MKTGAIIKYGFRIRTRNGLLVERLSIHGRDEAHAEEKLRRMYQHCQIIDRQVLNGPSLAGLAAMVKS
mgnify:CR=1 FL=1|jgi:hypothetical protein